MYDFIVAGLGNPEKRYEKTRHNIGFQIIDHIASLLSTQKFSNKFNSLYTPTKIENKKVILMKPMAYMNRSGLPLKQIANFFTIKTSNIIVIHDDLDMPFGTIKLKYGGGSAGHNGLKSIINSFNDKNFMRLRFGIGKPENINFDISNYVLSKFTKNENASIKEHIEIAAEIIFATIDKDMAYAMNRFN